MEISFSLEKADLVAFNRYDLKRDGKNTWGWLPLALLLIVACLVHGIQEGFEIKHFLAIGTLLIIFVGYLWLIRHQLNKTFKTGHQFVQNLTLKLTPEELIHANDLNRSATRWEAVDKVAIRRDHGFIYFTGGSALTIPKRAFADEDAFQKFMETARSYHESAKRRNDVSS